MSLTRKRRKALKRLQNNAEELWLDQQAVLDRANTIARETKKQLGELTKEELAPRVKSAVDTIAPAVTRNVAAAKVAADTVRSKFASDVLPALGTALGAAVEVLHVANNPTIRKVVRKTTSKSPIGRYFVIGAGLLAVAGVGYAVWQTFRADDELWISEDDIDASAEIIE
jgi:hypothetical protein